MPDETPGGSSWTLTLILRMYSAGLSIVLFMLTGLLMRQIDAHPLDGVIPFALLVLLAHGVLFRGIAHRLTQVSVAMANAPMMTVRC
ncbi:MAG: hypothetical protein ACOCYT_02610 [Chloroflexota bacterium]